MHKMEVMAEIRPEAVSAADRPQSPARLAAPIKDAKGMTAKVRSPGKAKRSVDKRPKGCMARLQAADPDLKRRAILNRCARLFAARGYARTSMSELASACQLSEARLRHYFATKEQLLYDLLKAHFIKLEEAVNLADAPGVPPVERLRGLVAALLAAYEGADTLHKVQMDALSALPMPRQQELKAYERRLVDLFARALREINPSLAKGNRLLRPVTMSLFGMLSWSPRWFRPGGPLARAAYANLVTQIMVDGIARLGSDSPTCIRLRSRLTSTLVERATVCSVGEA